MHYDVIVIGLGAMGAATLYQLAKRGVRVAGVDRYAPPHDQGSSHGDTRITRQAVGEGAAYVPLALNSQRIWRELEAQSGEALFEACGMLMLSSSHQPTRGHGTADFGGETAALAKRFGIEHRLLDAAGIRARFPQFGGFGDGATGYYEPGAGYVRPERAIEVQLRLAETLGAVLHGNTLVEAIESEAGGIRVRTSSGTHTADKAIVCAGMWTGKLLGDLAGDDAFLRGAAGFVAVAGLVVALVLEHHFLAGDADGARAVLNSGIVFCLPQGPWRSCQRWRKRHAVVQ